MDLVFGLLRSSRGNNVVWMIVDWLTKSAHFVAIKTTYSPDRLAKLYIQEVVQLHSVLVLIVSNRDLMFTSRF